MPDIWFPNLGVKIGEIDPVMISLFGIDIYWYGVIISIGVIAGLVAVMTIAKRSEQQAETYIDVLIFGLLAAIIGARLYYVIFSWEVYKDDLLSIFNLRQGGLAIFGGVIGGVIAVAIYAKVKKLNFFTLADTAAPGLILGQAIGRWGNFVNQEAFGGYADNLFAMRLKVENVRYLPASLVDTIMNVEGVDYLQVHPTFLYESMWNISVFIFLFVFWKYKKFKGEIFYLYLLCYSLGRVWIEGMRTDQLIIGSTNIPVSQLLSGLLIVFSLIVIIYNRKKCKINTI